MLEIGPHRPLGAALELARSSLCLTAPNPRVGCVLTSPDGTVIGAGHTQQAGGPHAEIMALRDAQARGQSTEGATAWVTLEPCSHHGRTGPCCDALIAAGIRKVVASLADPNPLVSGQGFARLRAAGVEVEVGLGAEESRELNIGFFSRMERQLPWVRMKLAASLDGKTALENGNSQWITSEPARADGHAWRARACTVLTGIGTVRDDNPLLDVRLVDTPRQPHLAVVDSRLETPPEARLFEPRRQVFIYAAIDHPARRATLEARGATVILLPDATSGAPSRVDLPALLRDLARREVNEVHVEAGYRLNGALIAEDLVDEIVAYLAPRLIGRGCDMARFGPLTDLTQAVPLNYVSAERIGPDLRVIARITGRDRLQGGSAQTKSIGDQVDAVTNPTNVPSNF